MRTSRTAPVALALALAFALGGCSVFNRFDPGRLDASGLDAGVEAGPDDGGLDAGDDASDGGVDANTDAFVCPGRHTREDGCGDGIDDDCDGLTDCADPDCVAAMAIECCAPGGTPTVERFNIDMTTSAWTTQSDWNAPASIVGAISAGALVNLGGTLTGMVNGACVQVDLGAELRFDLRATPCTSGEDCSGHVDVVVGPSATFSGMLTADLAVRGATDAAGVMHVDVLQGSSVRATSTMPIGARVASVVVNLSPGLAEGRAAIVASVAVSVPDPMGWRVPLVSGLFVADRDVFGTSSCHGLRLGIEGVGSHVALDNVSVAQLDCANPARFDALPHDDVVDAVTMTVSSADHTSGWGRGGIGDPSLLEGRIGSRHTFVLLFDGSPVDRASDVIGHLPLSIGGADTTATSGTERILSGDCHDWMPRGMPAPMAIPCTAPSTAAGNAVVESPLVVRDPTFFPDGRDPLSLSALRVVWSGEQTAGGHLALFASLIDATSRPARILGGSLTPISLDEDATRCPSLRNPLLLPMPRSTDWLLLYVCDSFPPVVHAARFDGSNASRLPGIELGPDQLGALAQQGVTDVAGVVYDYLDTASSTHTPTYRLWLTARPTTSDTVVLYVEGTPPAGAPDGTPPAFRTFPGNPVLTERSSVFGSCGIGCQLHGITATRISDEPTRVRLMVERWVDTGSGLTYGLVPLEQLWPRDR